MRLDEDTIKATHVRRLLTRAGVLPADPGAYKLEGVTDQGMVELAAYIGANFSKRLSIPRVEVHHAPALEESFVVWEAEVVRVIRA